MDAKNDDNASSNYLPNFLSREDLVFELQDVTTTTLSNRFLLHLKNCDLNERAGKHVDMDLEFSRRYAFNGPSAFRTHERKKSHQHTHHYPFTIHLVVTPRSDEKISCLCAFCSPCTDHFIHNLQVMMMVVLGDVYVDCLCVHYIPIVDIKRYGSTL